MNRFLRLQQLADTTHYDHPEWPEVDLPAPHPDGLPSWHEPGQDADPEADSELFGVPEEAPPRTHAAPSWMLPQPGQDFDPAKSSAGAVEVAGAHADPDLAHAEELLSGAKRHGQRVLLQLTRRAVARLALSSNLSRADRLFTDGERQILATTLASGHALADLLGRARIRLHERQAEQGVHEFADSAFRSFGPLPPVPMLPEGILERFKALLPKISRTGQFPAAVRQQGFAAAREVEQTLLGKVRGILNERLASGATRRAVGEIQATLSQAGVTPGNPQYSDMIFRTGLMSAYNRGSQDELQEPDVAEQFPAWQYLGIRDGRQGADHEPHFGKYYPVAIGFETVRGPRIFNCRCSSRPIFHTLWQKLQAQGAVLSTV